MSEMFEVVGQADAELVDDEVVFTNQTVSIGGLGFPVFTTRQHFDATYPGGYDAFLATFEREEVE